jgi:hypothetical protein
MPIGIAYLFAFGAVVLPPLGLVAMLLAGRAWRRGRRGAQLALLFAVLSTALGVAIWATVMPSTHV